MTPILALEQVSKQYPGVVALDRVDFTLERGEVRALLGKNGAGKSTLVKMLSGAVHPDSGAIRIDGQPVTIADPQDAFKQGIYTVYQEMSLVPGLTVAENILLGRWPRQQRAGPVGHRPQEGPAHRQGRARPARSLDQPGPGGRPAERGAAATGRDRQGALDAARACSCSTNRPARWPPVKWMSCTKSSASWPSRARPSSTSPIACRKSPTLPTTSRCCATAGLIGTITAAGSHARPHRPDDDRRGLAAHRMRGEPTQVGEVKLAVKNLNRGGVLKDVSFEVRGGEVLGLAGLLGSGRTELVRAIFGLDTMDSGEIYVKGERVVHPDAGEHEGAQSRLDARRPQATGAGSALLRARQPDHGQHGPLQRQRRAATRQGERAGRQRWSSRWRSRRPACTWPAQTLSGGNQQKVVVGNWLNTLPEVLLMDEPTRGIDIQAKEQIFSLVRDLAAQGLAVVFISSEIEEVLDVADRILVMHEGRITAEVEARRDRPGATACDGDGGNRIMIKTAEVKTKPAWQSRAGELLSRAGLLLGRDYPVRRAVGRSRRTSPPRATCSTCCAPSRSTA